MAAQEKYFLFVKPPDVKEMKKPGFHLSERDAQTKKQLLELLKEVDSLEALQSSISD